MRRGSVRVASVGRRGAPHTLSSMRSRRALAAVWAMLPLALLLLLLPALPTPELVPTHWRGRTPGGFTPGPAFLSVVITVVVLATLLAAASGVLQRMVPEAWSRWVVALAAALGWGALALYVVTVWRTEVDGAEQVSDAWVMVALLASLVAGAVGYVVHARRIPTKEQLDLLVPQRSRVQAVRGRAVRPVDPWSTEISSTTLRVIAFGVGGVFVALLVWMLTQDSGVLFTIFVGIVGLGAAVLALAWSGIRVRVDAEGMAIRSLVLPVQLSRVRCEDVVGVEVMELDPMKWGGIGLRPLPDRTAYIVNGGIGIVTYKRDGRRLAIQITEGDQAARVGARTLLRAAGQRLGETRSP